MSEDIYTTITSQSFSEGKNRVNGSTFRKWNIQDSDGNNYSKIVKDDFESPYSDGEAVRIVYNQNGIYKNIVDVLSSDGSQPGKKEATIVKKTPTVTPIYRDNSAGMRNGMITNNSIELAKIATSLAIARGETDVEGIQQAALDVMEVAKMGASSVKALADFVEKQS